MSPAREADRQRKAMSPAREADRQRKATSPAREARRMRVTSPAREADRRRKAFYHSSKQIANGKKCLEVLSGQMIVPELKNTTDSIGTMTDVCTYCNALKWSKETSMICCKNGQVYLPSLQPLPQYLNDLFFLNTPEALFFRKHV